MEINRNFLDALGFTLVDSLWQGLVIMAVAFLGLAIMKKAPARWRHNFLLVCILALPLGGLYSFSQHQNFSSGFLEGATPSEPIVGNVSDLIFVNEGYSTVSQLQMETFWLVDKAHWIGLLWLLGLILVSLRGVGGLIYLKRLKSNATEVEQTEIVELLERLRVEFGLKTAVLIKESSKVMSPLVSGYFKPIILFPLGLIQGLTTEEVEVILLHELAHLKRNDFLINVIINGLRAVYFYHPAYWWLQSQLDNEREYATDEMVMSKQSNGLILVKALAKTQEYKMTTPSLGFAGNSKNQLLKRVNRIMKKQQKPNWISGVFTIAILGVAFVLMSQSQQQTVETADSINEVEAQDTLKAVRPAFKLPSEEELENAKLRYIDSLGNRHVYLINAQKDTVDITVFPNREGSFDLKIDTTGIALAIQEIIKVPSPIMVEYDGNGEVLGIKKNGKELKGDEFNTYKKALTQLNQYATKRYKNDASSIEKLAKLAGLSLKQNAHNLSKLYQLAGVGSEDSVSIAEYQKIRERFETLNVQEQVRLMDAQQRVEALKKRQENAKNLIEELTKNPSTEQAIQLSKYMNELAQMERYMLRLREEEKLINKENEAFVKELELYRSNLQQNNELNEYVSELKTLIEIKADRSSVENSREAELQLRALEREMNEILSNQYKMMKEQALGSDYVKKKLIGSITERRNPKDKGLYEHTRVTPDNETFRFAKEDGRLLWVQYAFDILYNKELKTPLFQVDGKTMKKWGFNDFKAMDFLKITEIDFWANDDMQNHFKGTLSKRMLRTYDSVISIRTQ